MLKLKNISKKYYQQQVLKNINLDFKTKELVFVLGASGSGKSTLLNIIGKLLSSDSGEILLDNDDINKYKSKKIDKYRRTDISYIFQEYNLIEYMSVLDNLTIIKNNYDKFKIDKLLKKLSIYEKRNQKVSTLSGGEKQRVAIARAILKDSNIILCDEPTGALDCENSKKVIEILKELSKEKLVIVVSHNESLAKEYADRIINIKDGTASSISIFDDEKFKKNNNQKITNKKLTKISIKNLMLNKKRTIITSIASSIGVFCLILVSCLSKGFNKEIQELESKLLEAFPITIKNEVYEINNSNEKNNQDNISIKKESETYHYNRITPDYLEYIKKIKEAKYITYNYDILLPLITDSYNYLDKSFFESIPSNNYIYDNYELLKGRNILNDHEILLQIDSNNQIMSNLSTSFNINENIKYEDILGRKIKIILNDDYYQVKDNIYYVNNKTQNMYNKSVIELTIVGIVREKEIISDNSKILYQSSLLEEILKLNQKSQVIKNIKNNNYLIYNGLTKEETLSYLGYNTLPCSINIYVDNLKDKNIILNNLDKYKEVIYEDNIDEILGIVKDFTNIITIILIAFSLISLLVAAIMISLLTNNRILERKKEIGILRSLGASKGNIKRIFNLENIIISILSIIISISGVLILKLPINNLLYNFLGSKSILTIDYISVAYVSIFDIIITIISGLIPIKRASNMDIANCIKEI